MANDTQQIQTWTSDFGREYTDRNPQSIEAMEALYAEQWGVSRRAINEESLAPVDRSARILEVGSNVGTQLRLLQSMGFTNLHGIEIQEYAIAKARELSEGIEFTHASALELPFEDDSFDLVFTSGVLIHISPADLGTVIDQMVRCSRRWIWGFEYYAEQHTEIAYRGHDALLWKGDFAGEFIARHPELRLVSQRFVPYTKSDNRDAMYLLERG